jgi:hypothetical protein
MSETEEFAPRRRFDENKVKRNKGRFAKKVGKALLTGGVPASRLDKTAPAQVFARHDDGDVTHVSRDGKTRLQYDASTGRFNKQEIQDDGTWETTESLGKLAAFMETSTGWRVANDQDRGAGARAIPAPDDSDDADTPDAPDTPDAAAPAPAPDTPEPRVVSTGQGPRSAIAFAPVDPDYPTRSVEEMEATTSGGPDRTSEQTAAIRNFTGTGYQDMNTCLRTGNGCTPEIQAQNAELESSMTTTTEPATVFRTMSLSNLAGGVSESDLASLVGSEISDSGFTSTSLNPAQTSLFGEEPGSVNVQIEMPAGTRAVVPGSDSLLPEEETVILPQGTRYRVLETVPPADSSGRPSIRIQVIP